MVETVDTLERLNEQTRARKLAFASTQSMEPRTVSKPMNGEGEFGEIGFTSKDREALIRLTVKFEEIDKKIDRYEGRFALIERERISKEEADRIAQTLAEKVTRLALDMAKMETNFTREQGVCTTENATLRARVESVERQIWKWIAYTGGAFAGVAFVLHFFKVI